MKDEENNEQIAIGENEEPAKSLKEFCDLPVASKIKNASPSSICEIDVLNKPLINPEKSPSPIIHKTFLNDRNLSISPADSTNNSILQTENIHMSLDSIKEKYNPITPSDSAYKDVCQPEGMYKKRPVPTPRKSLLKKLDVINTDQTGDVLSKTQEQISPLNIANINLHDSLPIPVLKAQTTDEMSIESDLQLPVSSHYSKDMSRTEDKWKVRILSCLKYNIPSIYLYITKLSL